MLHCAKKQPPQLQSLQNITEIKMLWDYYTTPFFSSCYPIIYISNQPPLALPFAHMQALPCAHPRYYSNNPPWKKTFRRNQNAKETMLRYLNEKWKMTTITWWLQKNKTNPADRASYFTVITQFICTQQQKSLILNLFPFEFFLNSLKKTSINFPVRNFWKKSTTTIHTIYLSTRKRKK